MPFEIQVCNPAIRDRSHEERESLSSAMIAVFPEHTEDAYLVWNWVPVRMNYSSDLHSLRNSMGGNSSLDRLFSTSSYEPAIDDHSDSTVSFEGVH